MNYRVHTGTETMYQSPRDRADQSLAVLRQRFLIPSRWIVDLEMKTAEEMPCAYGSCSWEYLPYQRFLIKLRDDLSGDQMFWTLTHELLEAMMAGYADLCDELIAQIGPKRVRDLYQARQAWVRDDLIEWIIRILLQTERPPE